MKKNESFLTVGDLIKKLSKLPKNAICVKYGSEGHGYNDIYNVDKIKINKTDSDKTIIAILIS